MSRELFETDYDQVGAWLLSFLTVSPASVVAYSYPGFTQEGESTVSGNYRSHVVGLHGEFFTQQPTGG